ncbi:glycoside hydrolase family 9 protein [Paenibacillus sp. MWE-103]|uniref:Glycoside hydrolase family 9 protein n=1 Tax=Paenibacillus artemisiicola TaxID=1172618 RepID=A0ABS3W839_9BACL|nr:glycoside hydrolase family 9 protein [Paenibacillus artemisiicola]MBO7744468.1 glycoside hydrolase family 9 protein [Paenibacillus artemisiicola]
MASKIERELERSNLIHRPLQVDESASLEADSLKKEVLDRVVILDQAVGGDRWMHRGLGASSVLEGGLLQLTSPFDRNAWPEGSPSDGDYSTYGHVGVYREFDHENWEHFNRITFEIYPECSGMSNPHIKVGIKNDGTIKIPDIYHREGSNVINLKNRQWNVCAMEIPDLPRDGIIELEFCYDMYGKDRATGDTMNYRIRNVFLEKVAYPNISKGWQPRSKDIIFSHNGYSLEQPKTMILTEQHTSSFTVIEHETGEEKFTGPVNPMSTSIGSFSVVDFSAFKEKGKYIVRVGDLLTRPFEIGGAADRWEASIWKSINFIYCERCGCPVHGIHGSCHEDILARHNGGTIIFNGGWHDAGDVSQQLVQTAEVASALYEIAHQVKERNYPLYLRLVEEGEWGVDFILKTRFGDGYRATSAGIRIWSDGIMGNMDDMTARVHNNPYENFILSGIEAQIAMFMEDGDLLKDKLTACANQDFNYAVEQFELRSFAPKPIFWEHTYMSSESLFMATASWSASLQYQLTGEASYAIKAVEYLDYVIDSQELAGIQTDDGKTVAGFFYRTPEKKVIQHFNHQAREHMYLQAFSEILKTQPEHAKRDSWMESVRSYGEYIKFLTAFTAPYPMISSGIYHVDENEDRESFELQHLLVGEEAKAWYTEQLRQGVRLNDCHYLKRFPVWFSFKGNTAIVLSTGKAASLTGMLLEDQELISIAESQLQWVVGKNPFGQSLMYGEGYNFAQQYSVLSGEIVGEIPVGVQTFENEDIPYWPQMNNATYKEVWVGLAGKWLSLLSDLYAYDKQSEA